MLFTVFRAPDWAEGPGRPAGIPAGSWNPDPGRFGQFGSALARRYSGSFSPAPGVPPLPRVRYFEAWNEPNLTNFFAPQRVGDQVVSPDAYRTLLNSFYDAVHAVDPDNVVISGGTGAYGDPPGGERTRPVAFLRQLFCLQGQQLEPQPCPQTRMDTLGHHPFGHPNPPTYSTINPDDAGISDIGRLERVLRAAEKAGVVAPGGKRPIWATEFWWITRPPPNPDAVANEAQQARYIEQALYLFWKQGVSVAIQYLIRDSGVPFNTGLFFSDGRQKLSFQAFRFPFVTDRLSAQTRPGLGKVAEGRQGEGPGQEARQVANREAYACRQERGVHGASAGEQEDASANRRPRRASSGDNAGRYPSDRPRDLPEVFFLRTARSPPAVHEPQ